MTDHGDLLQRIEHLSARAAASSPDFELLSEIEDVLAEGYMHALTEEARSRRIGSRLDRLVEKLNEPSAAVEARRLALQRRTLDHRIEILRARLTMIREQFISLGGGQSAAG
jgi:hypothetical protein